MAKRSVSIPSVTPTAFGDTAGLTDTNYPFVVLGGSATQRTNILEVYMGGQATASAAAYMVLGRDSTVAGTLVAGGTRDASLDAATAALAAPVLTGNSATVDPQRSSTLHLLNLAFNAFGGVVRWVAAPGEEITIVGNTQPLGEVSLSGFTGTGAGAVMGAHLIYETF